MTTRTCEPRAGVAPRHALGVTSQSPAGNACETTELPGKCCLAPTASSKPQKTGTLPSPTPVGACPAGCLSHMCAHSHTCMHVHTLAWDSGAERTQEGPTASPTPPCSPACPTTGGQDHTHGECACGKCLGRWAGQLPKVSVSRSGPAPRRPTAEGLGPCPQRGQSDQVMFLTAMVCTQPSTGPGTPQSELATHLHPFQGLGLAGGSVN